MMPAWHWAITSAGEETMNIGAPTTGQRETPGKGFRYRHQSPIPCRQTARPAAVQ